MFDKENKKEIEIVDIKHNGFCKIKDLLVTPAGAIMINTLHTNKDLQEQMDYQDRVTSYINRKHELDLKKNYNPIIVNLYENGLIIIDKEKYRLVDFFIVFQGNNYNIMCTDEKYTNEKYEYNKAVKFIDTTAFIKLINNKDTIVTDNKIIIENSDILKNIVHEWDGYLHSETKETDAIKNKRMIDGDDNA